MVGQNQSELSGFGPAQGSIDRLVLDRHARRVRQAGQACIVLIQDSDKAQRIIEALPVTGTLIDRGESFNGWPVWAVPASFGEQVASTPLSPEIVRGGEERARELRLYAARLEVLDGRNLGWWD